MRKLSLKLEDLRVDSFDTTTVRTGTGTVFAEQCTCQTQCTCPGINTCNASCNGTCDASACGGASCIGGTACETDAPWRCPHEN